MNLKTGDEVRRDWQLRSYRTPVSSVCFCAFLGAVLFSANTQTFSASAQQKGVVANWEFNSPENGYVIEQMRGTRAAITGSVFATAGPAGPAIEFDGYTGAIHGDGLPLLDRGSNATVVCWVQMEAYPWNDLPLLDQEDSQGRFYFGVDSTGHLIASFQPVASAAGTVPAVKSQSAISQAALPLRKWTLLSLSLDERGEMSFLMDGKSIASQALSDEAIRTIAESSGKNAGSALLIGHVRGPLLPGPSSMIHPLLPVEYSLQGSLGSLTVYDRALTGHELEMIAMSADKRWFASSEWPKLPRWEGGKGPFGAYYTTLSFDPAWDRTRRIGPDSDVVVRFEGAPIQLVFWQGNNYVPAWVTENNRWYTDEFMETYGHPQCPDGEDCEPMSDKQSRYSHVRILENSPARAVVHWRYALAEVQFYHIGNSSSPTAWGDWADEYWTVYPDGVAVRKSVLWSTAADREKTEFQESIVLIPPGERPEENVNFNAITFANLEGETFTYNWQPKSEPGLALPNGPGKFTKPDNAVIQTINLKSAWKPFSVAWGSPVTFDVYNGEKSTSSFEWWNHWPVAQIPSSGRPALAADRAGHTSLSHIYWPVYERDGRHISKILLDGLSNLPARQLAPLARAWRNPPGIEATGANGAHYDAAQRAYVLSADASSPVRITLHGSTASPILNPAFVLEGWKGKATVTLQDGSDGQAQVGQVDRLDRSDLVIFLPVSRETDLTVEIRRD
jgi:hypothetical protein